MKAIKSILLILVGVIISCGCSVFAVSRYLANQVEYTSQKSILAVNNVGDALDELYAQTTFGNPTGTILTYMGNNAPSGYLKCDGTIYNISEYSNLANQIKTEFGSFNYFGGNGTTTFAVPDLRGEFLRGTGNNSHENQGNGANVGVHQNGTLSFNMNVQYVNNKGLVLGVWGTMPNNTTGEYQLANNSIFADKVSLSSYNGGTQVYRGNAVLDQGITGATTTMHTTRPTNTSVLYVIKY